MKTVLGVIAGFVAWSIVWVGSDQVLMTLIPGWYGTHQLAFERAINTGEPFAADASVLVFHLVRATLVSVLSGFLAAFVAGENRRAPLALGIVLLVVGIGVEAMAWNYAPVWYHALFLVLLIPMTVLGGRLKSSPAMQ